ncbi:GbsR/MarR family transcriptional regulator [Pantanalinema sp. GBBB05]|uniref:GbsR/MarR family transcriptional regulator n=1 Tax=Pantanalinema sp. GBBB05 TaxID=2604139 RepID=UPI001E037362|nr:MarR family transcriptional regulator [Pantanalinema sp. GBBB05]
MDVANQINASHANVNQEQRQFEQKHFIEEVGLLFEMVGLPRMAGRVFGWLLISNPPYQSPGELAAVLQASKGSISTMTRLLVQIGLIERISLPGQRRDYFRIKLDAWSELTKQRMAQITAFRRLAERGLELLHDEEPNLRRRLEEMRDMHAFCERELPLMIERWEQQRLHSQ